MEKLFSGKVRSHYILVVINTYLKVNRKRERQGLDFIFFAKYDNEAWTTAPNCSV
jgi:hypothetical protein